MITSYFGIELYSQLCQGVTHSQREMITDAKNILSDNVLESKKGGHKARPCAHRRGIQDMRFKISDAKRNATKAKGAHASCAPGFLLSTVDRQLSPRNSRLLTLDFRLDLIPATTDSPTRSPAQYHGPWRA